MTVIARDAVAADHMVYCWPFPIGPECDIACAAGEQVVMCPAWLVGDRLGPGHHRWRTPDPTRPVGAYFVSTSPVEVAFDMQTQFMIPATGEPVRLRGTGSVFVACNDPGLLIAQFVGLPFDAVNDGVMRSVSRSIERMLARLLTRRVLAAGTPAAATDPTMTASIVEELISYNPAAGAVFGVELASMGTLVIDADDGSGPWMQAPPLAAVTSTLQSVDPPARGSGTRIPTEPLVSSAPYIPAGRAQTEPPNLMAPATADSPMRASYSRVAVELPPADPEVAALTDAVHAPPTIELSLAGRESRSSIVAVGASAIGAGPLSSSVSGEIAQKVPPGARVLVPGPHGLMQSATVRQLQQGYYELEVGSSGETIWVPISGVIPEPV